MIHFPGNEVINFQANSRLGKNLTAIFQEIIDYREELNAKEYADDETRHATVVNSVAEHFVKYSIPKIIELLRTANINITEFYAYTGDYGFTYNAAVIVASRDIAAMLESRDRMTGQINWLFDYDVSEKDILELAKISDITNLKTGEFSQATFSKGKKVNAALFFDVNAFLLTHEFFAGDADKRFEADEIAAILLHEIGHIHTISEHMSQLYEFREREQNIELTIRKASLETLYKAAPKVAAEAKKSLQAASKKLNKDDQTVVDKVISLCDRVVQLFSKDDYFANVVNGAATVEEISTGKATPGKGIVSSRIVSFLMLILQMLLIAIVTAVKWAVFIVTNVARAWNPLGTLLSIPGYLYNLSVLLSHLRPGQGFRESTDTKLSDNTSTMMNVTYVERWADEYVSRMGYGAQMSSALNKLDYWMTVASGSITPMYNAAMRNSTLVSGICYACGWLVRNGNPLRYFTDGFMYEEMYARVKRLHQNTLAIFKNENLPGAVVDNYLGSIRQLEEEMAKAKTVFDTDVAKMFAHLYYSIRTVSGLKDLLTDANLERDYYNLQNRLDDLSNNSLFYQAARLSRN